MLLFDLVFCLLLSSLVFSSSLFFSLLYYTYPLPFFLSFSLSPWIATPSPVTLSPCHPTATVASVESPKPTGRPPFNDSKRHSPNTPALSLSPCLALPIASVENVSQLSIAGQGKEKPPASAASGYSSLQVSLRNRYGAVRCAVQARHTARYSDPG